MLGEDRPTIQAINPRTWIKSTDYVDQEFRPSLQTFSSSRRTATGRFGSRRGRWRS